MTGFEGSYLGDTGRISPAAVMECKVCWHVYDPAEGDPSRQIGPGTAFRDLPLDWSCPDCSAPAAQFLVREDPGSAAAGEAAAMAAATARIEADFREIWHARMRDVPLCNPLLRVEAVGFRRHEGRPLGVLVTPWCMNLVLLPAEGEDWSGLRPGARETLAFPSGEYEFLHNRREMTGGYKTCALFSTMGDFRSHAQATEVAAAVMAALFDPANRAETDRAAEIRAAAERAAAAPAAPPPAPPLVASPIASPAPADAAAPTRRGFLLGGG